MFLVTRYRGMGCGGGGGGGDGGGGGEGGYNPSDDPCYETFGRICWVAAIIVSLILSVYVFASFDDTWGRIVAGSVLLLIGLVLMFGYWMRRVYKESVKRRARIAERRDRRTKSEAIIQIGASYDRGRLSEDLEETLPLDEPPPAYEDIKT